MVTSHNYGNINSDDTYPSVPYENVMTERNQTPADPSKITECNEIRRRSHLEGAPPVQAPSESLPVMGEADSKGKAIFHNFLPDLPYPPKKPCDQTTEIFLEPTILKKTTMPIISLNLYVVAAFCVLELTLGLRQLLTHTLSPFTLVSNLVLSKGSWTGATKMSPNSCRKLTLILTALLLTSADLTSAQTGQNGLSVGSIRLIGGEGSMADPNTGRIYQGNVQVWLNGSWGHVCDDEWDMEEANVVCRQLGFEGAKSRTRNSEYGIVTKYWLDNLNCDGTESSLMECRSHACDGTRIKDCQRHWGKNNCLISEAAGVICNNPPNHISDNGIEPSIHEPIDPGVRNIDRDLVLDATDSEATTTVVVAAAVTRPPFPPTTATEVDEFFRSVNIHSPRPSYPSVITRSPGWNNGSNYRRRAQTIPTSQPVTSNESSLGGAVARRQRPRQAVDNFVGAQSSGHVTQSSRDFRRYNNRSESLVRPPPSIYGANGQRAAAQGDASGTYYDQYYQGGGGDNTMGAVQLRLIGGNQFSGRVEISMANGPWGTICGDAWTVTEANVICRMLSFGYAEQALQGAQYGTSTGPMLVSGVNCQGSEPHLSSCRFKTGAGMACPGATNIAGVVCGQQLPDLVVDYREVEQTIHVDTRSMAEITCAMEENCVSESAYKLVQNDMASWKLSKRRLLRFTLAMANIGQADFLPYLPKKLWDWHQCHEHYHSFEVFSTYKVLDASGASLANGHKASFCLEDAQCKYDVFPQYQCRDFGNQGISVGCVDVYRYDIDCQWVDISDLAVGKYRLEIVVNPERKVAELDYENNRVVCDIEWDGYQVTTTGCRIEPNGF